MEVSWLGYSDGPTHSFYAFLHKWVSFIQRYDKQLPQEAAKRHGPTDTLGRVAAQMQTIATHANSSGGGTRHMRDWELIPGSQDSSPRRP